jgi:hypothetical protein
VSGDKAGRQFIAITDPGMQLQRDAERDRFRKVFLNMADIGGRYSALSYFGIVPMALAGVDVEELLERAAHTAHIARMPQIDRNPAARLGVFLGALAMAGRDKVTLITPRPLDALGLWIEQLVAESTGKEGKGILPIAGEPAVRATEYGNDRVFVAVRLRGSDGAPRLHALTEAGHPTVDFLLEDPLDLGEVFYVWEFATAVAGAVIAVNPFDQPNVQESKDNTRRLLAGEKPRHDARRVSVGDSAAVEDLLSRVRAGDYVALTQYFAETVDREKQLDSIRETLARDLHVATTSGYGPRFLHSTGQLHKGGGGNGVFLQLTGGPSQDVPIPGEPFTFGTLVRAQAVGDIESLASRERRVLSIDLGEDVDRGLETLRDAVTRFAAGTSAARA